MTNTRKLILTVILLLFPIYSYAVEVDDSSFMEQTSNCNPIRVLTCALPYPSDYYTIKNEESSTGRLISMPEIAIRPELLEEVPPSLTIDSIFNGSTGYSPASGVVFELYSRPDLESIPADGGTVVIAYDLTTHERIPIRVQLNEYARSSLVAEKSQIIEVFPRSRWNFGSRYAIFLTKELKKEQGGDYETSPGFLQAISNDGSDLANFYEPVIQLFEAKGGDRDQLISATFFTVRDEAEVTQPLLDIAESVYNKEHPIRNLKVFNLPFGSIRAIVTGEMLAYDFRDQYGGMKYDLNEAQENWLKFRLTLPKQADHKPVPISIYGHGLSIFKESDIVVSLSNASLGIATIAIDHPNHGSRIIDDGGYVLTRVDTPYVPMQLGMMIQSPIDHISLLKAIKTSIGSLDILPRKSLSSFLTAAMNNSDGDGIPDIDTEQIIYQGTSLGGVLGSTFLAMAPDVKGGFLQVGGTGITSILSGSALWNVLFERLEPDIATGAEALLLRAAIQHELDYGDGINFAHYIRSPQGIATTKSVAVTAGMGDSIVPNFSTIAFAEIANLPLMTEELFPKGYVYEPEEDTDGFGLYQHPPLLKTNVRFIDEALGHISFLTSSGRKDMELWIKDILERED